MDGRIGVFRELPLADRNVSAPGVGHSPFDPKLWTKNDWWLLLNDSTPKAI